MSCNYVCEVLVWCHRKFIYSTDVRKMAWLGKFREELFELFNVIPNLICMICMNVQLDVTIYSFILETQ
jgi:hypothetical protein